MSSEAANAHKAGAGKGISLGLARYFAWVFLALIVCFTVALVLFIGRSAQDTQWAKQRESAGILAVNMNHQLFVRFVIPTIVLYGGVNLREDDQYNELNELVTSLIHGTRIHSLRIFAPDGIITYSAANREEAGREGLASPAVLQAMGSQEPVFNLESSVKWWEAFFAFQVKPGSYYLRATTALRYAHLDDVLGVLEFVQDVSTDMGTVIRLQWSIIGITLVSSLMLFWLFMVFLRRAESVLRARMAEEQRLLHELHQHEKLAGMGRVVAGIAHEIRNPLGIIRSSAELLLGRQHADPLTGKILQAIFAESSRLSQTVSDFLDYARPSKPQQADVNMEQVFSELFNFLGPALSQQEISVVCEFSGEAQWLVRGDKDLLYRAFYNILTNSIQAMQGAGVLRVLGGKTSRGGRDFVEITCSDSGPGFPKEGRDRLLDPFVTTKDGGTGLGLAIVSSIIASHGGFLAIEDAPEGGGQVRVSLPAHGD